MPECIILTQNAAPIPFWCNMDYGTTGHSQKEISRKEKKDKTSNSSYENNKIV